MRKLIAWFNHADKGDYLAFPPPAPSPTCDWKQTTRSKMERPRGRVLIDLVLARQRQSQPANTHLAAAAGKAPQLLCQVRTRPARLARRDGIDGLVHRPITCCLRADVRGDGTRRWRRRGSGTAVGTGN